MHSDPLLRIERLSKTYSSGRGLADVSLEVPAGQIVCLGGPNGSGKSTLLRCLAGISRYRGDVWIGGAPANGGPAVRREVGYLPQSLMLPESATIGEVIVFFADLRGVDPDETRLPEDFTRDYGELVGPLSIGQRQRVGLRVALLGTPKLLLLDEPVASLDQEGREQFWQVLRDLRDSKGMSCLIASPSPSDLVGVADRAISMIDGRIVADEVIDRSGGPRDLDEVKS